MPARTLLSSEQRIRLFSIPPKWSAIPPSVRTISRSSARSDARSTGSDSPSSYASSGIPASAWPPLNNHRKP